MPTSADDEDPLHKPVSYTRQQKLVAIGLIFNGSTTKEEEEGEESKRPKSAQRAEEKAEGEGERSGSKNTRRRFGGTCLAEDQ